MKQNKSEEMENLMLATKECLEKCLTILEGLLFKFSVHKEIICNV